MQNPKPRAETGVMQFGDDWPGIFIRGDNAFFYKHALDKLICAACDACVDAPILIGYIRDLFDLLDACDKRRNPKPQMAQLIEADTDEENS